MNIQHKNHSSNLTRAPYTLLQISRRHPIYSTVMVMCLRPPNVCVFIRCCLSRTFGSISSLQGYICYIYPQGLPFITIQRNSHQTCKKVQMLQKTIQFHDLNHINGKACALHKFGTSRCQQVCVSLNCGHKQVSLHACVSMC